MTSSGVSPVTVWAASSGVISFLPGSRWKPASASFKASFVSSSVASPVVYLNRMSVMSFFMVAFLLLNNAAAVRPCPSFGLPYFFFLGGVVCLICLNF